MDEKSDKETAAAQAALADLKSSLSHAKELVERTRSLLAGEPPPAEEGAPSVAGEGDDATAWVDATPKPA